jgi:hypothetical protein
MAFFESTIQLDFSVEENDHTLSDLLVSLPWCSQLTALPREMILHNVPEDFKARSSVPSDQQFLLNKFYRPSPKQFSDTMILWLKAMSNTKMAYKLSNLTLPTTLQ